MGTQIEINDTLRISRAQGFPGERLDLATHLTAPYTLADVEPFVFSFHTKPGIRVYKAPPVRNFLVEDVDGKWVYWGLCHIIEVVHDYENATTAGKFIITHVNTPDDMRAAFRLIDRVASNNYFDN